MVSDDLAAATDFPPLFKDRVQVEVFDLRLLARLGVPGRATTAAEGRDGLTGPLLYNDLPGDPAAFDADRTYAATRADVKLVARLVMRYNAIFGTPDADRTEEIARELAESTSRWQSLEGAGAFDPVAYRRYVETSPAERGLAARIAALEALLNDMRLLGLTPAEYRLARARLLRVLAPNGGPSVDQLAEMIQVTRPGT